MPQINQYPNECLIVKSDDLFDVDKIISTGPTVFESQKLKFSTLVAQITAAITPANLGNTNLTQTPSTSLRTYDADQGLLQWIKLSGKDIFLNNAAVLPTGVNIVQSRDGAAIANNALQTWRFGPDATGGRTGQVYEDGSFAMRKGAHYFSDGAGPGILGATSQPDNRFLMEFRSNTKTTRFGQGQAAAGVIPQDSIAWFDSNSKGVLFPSLTTAQRNAITTPRLGLVIFNTTVSALQCYDGTGGTGWKNL